MNASLAFILAYLLAIPIGHAVTAKDGNWLPKFIINLSKLPILHTQKQGNVFQIGPKTFMTAAHVVTLGSQYVFPWVDKMDEDPNVKVNFNLCSNSVMKNTWAGLSFEFGQEKFDPISKKWILLKGGKAVMGKYYCSCFFAENSMPKPSPDLPDPECKETAWGSDDWIIFSYYDEIGRKMLAPDLKAWLDEWYSEGYNPFPAPGNPLVPDFYKYEDNKSYLSLDLRPPMKDEEVLFIGPTAHPYNESLSSTHPYSYDVYSAGLMQVEEAGKYGATLKTRQHLGWVRTHRGDSGGPWFRIYDDASIRVIGVHSSGDNEGTSGMAIFSSIENQAIIHNFIQDSGAQICGVNLECEPNYLPIDAEQLYVD